MSLEDDLLKQFDRLIAKRGYQNRSEAIRDLIREALLAETVASNKPVVGTLTLVYDHHVPNLARKLTEVQHNAGSTVLAATEADVPAAVRGINPGADHGATRGGDAHFLGPEPAGGAPTQAPA